MSTINCQYLSKLFKMNRIRHQRELISNLYFLEWKIQAEDEEPEDEDCEIVEENLALARLQNKGHHENTLVQVKITKIQSTFLLLSKVTKI